MSTLVAWLDRTFYPTYQANWDSRRFREWALARLEGDHSLLDYGAGRGAVAELNFRGAVDFVAGVDPDPAVLDHRGLDEAKVLTLPEARIPYPDDRFDRVLAVNVLEHLPAPAGGLREIRRVLKPGGLLLAKTPNRRHYVALLARMTPTAFHRYVNARRGRPATDTFPTFYRANTRRQLARFAAETGFELTELENWEGRPEYCRLNAGLYSVGLVYERIVNRFDALAAWRSVIVFAMRKPPGCTAREMRARPLGPARG